MKKNLVLILVLFSLLSCKLEIGTSEVLDMGDILSAKDNLALLYLEDSLIISEEELEQEVLSFASSRFSSFRNAKTVGKKFSFAQVKIPHTSIYPNGRNISQQEETIEIYLMPILEGLNPCGYALVTQDKRLGSILFITKETSFSTEEDNPFLDLFMPYVQSYAENQLKCYYEITEEDIEVAKEKQKLVKNSSSQWSLCEEITQGALPTSWKQTSPYNDVVNTIKGKNYFAGCVGVAIAQIMAKHRYPLSCSLAPYKNENYDWDAILAEKTVTRNTKEAFQVGMLLYEIGHYAKLDYQSQATGGYSKDVAPCFRTLGFKTPKALTNYNLELIKKSLKNGNPVFVAGYAQKSTFSVFGLPIFNFYDNGHAWVIDGYLKRQNSQTGKIEEYVYCNPGWGSYFNGYYLNSLFDFDSYLATLSESSRNSYFFQHGLKILSDVSR
ncbi:MAG: hypothetical protein E7062_00445 [Spirochaetaceae bacterium]|nr:hypothetical protein [Spirochaetaceae bacterium]